MKKWLVWAYVGRINVLYVIVIAVTAGAWLLLTPDEVRLPDYESIGENQPLQSLEEYHKAHHPECAAEQRTQIRGAVERRDAREECARKRAEDQQKYWELTQSIRANNASEEALRLSAAQTQFAVLQLGLTFGTAALAFWAGLAAYKALRHTYAAERPYIWFESYPRISADGCSFRFKLRNFGRTAASLNSLAYEVVADLPRRSPLELRPYFREGVLRRPGTPIAINRVLGPESVLDREFVMPIPNEQLGDRAVLTCRIAFQDLIENKSGAVGCTIQFDRESGAVTQYGGQDHKGTRWNYLDENKDHPMASWWLWWRRRARKNLP